jgi:peptidoglycan/xylan/chitin deacetylase (PgdA/CDA1 family)
MRPYSQPALRVVSYHYVRDLSRSRFPRLLACSIADFRAQLRELEATCEMATLESALAFMDGDYRPARDLCLLTFDDGLRDHYDEVFPLLHERGIQGVFFLTTACLQGELNAVHQIHFLMAHLGLGEYRRRVLDALALEHQPPIAVDGARARATYRWDTAEAAEFKYLMNFVLPDAVKQVVIGRIFTEVLGNPSEFARELYLDWSEAATMQSEQMVAGGHTHTHRLLASLSPQEQRNELYTCTRLLRERLPDQTLWPFSFPYGKLDSFNDTTVDLLKGLDYHCAFTTVPGDNGPATDAFAMRRIDPKEVLGRSGW